MIEFRQKCAIESVARVSANLARWFEDTEKKERKRQHSTAQREVKDEVDACIRRSGFPRKPGSSCRLRQGSIRHNATYLDSISQVNASYRGVLLYKFYIVRTLTTG